MPFPETDEAPPRRPAAHEIPSSLFTQIFALVLVTVAVAQLINLALLAVLPPDPPRTVPIGALSDAILARDEAALTFTRVPVAPPRDSDNSPALRRLETDLANLLGRDPADVTVRVTDVQGRRFVEVYPHGGKGEPEPALIGHFLVGVRQKDGWLLVEPRDQNPFNMREKRFLLLFISSAFIMLPAAWLFARRLARPFEQFADAAERIGRDPRALPPKVEGPEEVERAAEAVRQMQQRLQAYVTDRTQMLGAIAHDLRTPLTRLAFRLETLDGPERERMRADVAEMEAMVKATLGFARADSQPPERQRLELGSLVEKVADDLAETGHRVSAEVKDMLVVEGDVGELRRLISNLLENGEAYGHRARARVWKDGGHAVVDIEDEGPGIPEAELERVFEPFYRLERSRSRETGGTGLGLSVVRSIARAHGGDVELMNRRQGGLRARVILPLAA
ncbi:ATP-binding protein [Sandaracinobacter sp. RS1-74]|uniref:ATP-binding protein n=1 Tax=Sandaracinobacteroides sayramensis TaxID=2913411 RepID=UPI001ED9C964|nr:ATP-binding protein [Sandaracinobacteroides sayramensis]MCG2841687.1 ATP-binding protein [Sandaracinobacteroides sayramensis]